MANNIQVFFERSVEKEKSDLVLLAGSFGAVNLQALEILGVKLHAGFWLQSRRFHCFLAALIHDSLHWSLLCD